jgi:hypothetical protein
MAVGDVTLTKEACDLRHGACGGVSGIVERAADALHGGRIDTELLGDHSHTRTAWLTQRGPYGVFLLLRFLPGCSTSIAIIRSWRSATDPGQPSCFISGRARDDLVKPGCRDQ